MSDEEPTRAEVAEAHAIARRVTDLLREKPGMVHELVEVIHDGLKATKRHWDGVAKQMVEAPDWSARREFAKLAMAYLEGLPAQTVLNVGVDASAKPDLVAALRRSPNARRAVQRLVEQLGKPVEETDQ